MSELLMSFYVIEKVCFAPWVISNCTFIDSDMKNAVIGNNKQKANLIVLGAVPR